GWYTAPFGQGERLTCELGNPYLHETLWIDGLTTAYPFFANALAFIWDIQNQGFLARVNPNNTWFNLLVSTLTIPASVSGQPVVMLTAFSFSMLNNIVTVKIPNTIRYISRTAFDSSFSITSFEVYKVLGYSGIHFDSYDGIIYRITRENDLYTNQITSRVPALFPLGKGGHIIFPELVMAIPDSFFVGAAHLQEITINYDLLAINRRAFYGVRSLIKVNFANSRCEGNFMPRITTIGSEAFRNTSLTQFTVPASVRDVMNEGIFVSGIGYGAFAYSHFANSSLQSFTFEESNYPLTLQANPVFSDAHTMFQNARFTCFEVPARVVSIGAGVFRRTRNLTNFTFETGGTLPLTIGTATGTNFNGSIFTGGSSIDASQIQSIEIPARTERIGNGAFSNMQSLNSVTFEQVQALNNIMLEIGAHAFSAAQTNQNNMSLTNIEIPARVIYIGQQAFYRNRGIAQVTFQEGNRPLTIGVSAFRHMNALTIVVPSRTEYIMYSAFDNNSNLNLSFALGTINCPEGIPILLSLGNHIFRQSTPFTTITLPARLSFVSNYTFVSAANLMEIIIEDGGMHFSSREGVLLNAEGYELVFLPRGRTGEWALPSGITTIATNALRDNQQLTHLTIPYGVVYIGANAFRNNRFSELIFAAPVGSTAEARLTIGADAFRDNLSLSSITFEEGSNVVVIGAGAFQSSVVLTSLILPNTLENIGVDAFAGNILLANVTFESRPVGGAPFVIGERAFQGNIALTSMHFPEHLTDITAATLGGAANIITLTVDENNPFFTEVGGVIYDTNKTRIVLFPRGRSNYNFTSMPNTVTHLDAGLFNGFVGLVGIQLSYNISYIGNQAFFNASNLTNIHFRVPANPPSNFELPSLHIGNDAFRGLIGLAPFSIPNRISHIGNNAFDRNSALEGTIKLCYTLQEIGNSAFHTTRITQLDIPEGSMLRHIGSDAFTSAIFLQDIIFPSNILNEVAFRATHADNPHNPGQWFTIQQNAFWNTRIQSFTFPARIATVRIDGVGGAPGVIEPWIANSMFRNNSALTSIAIPAHITNIGFGAFHDATALHTVTFAPNSQLRRLGLDSRVGGGTAGFPTIAVGTRQNEVFRGTTSLVSIDLSDTQLRYLGAATFRGSGISSVQLPDTLFSIGSDAFRDTSNIRHINIPNNVMSRVLSPIAGDDTSFNISNVNTVLSGVATGTPTNATFSSGVNVFRNSGLETITLPNNANFLSIPFGWFRDSNLQSIHIPASVTNIFPDAFANATELVSVTFAPVTATTGLQQIFPRAFDNTPKLQTLVLPTGGRLTHIGQLAFRGTGLQTLTIPNTVTNIGNAQNTGTNLHSMAALPTEGATDNNSRGVIQNSRIQNLIFQSGNYTPALNQLNIRGGSNTEASPGVFAFAPYLRYVRFSGRVNQIGRWSFANNPNLRYIHFDVAAGTPIPLTIGQEAFAMMIGANDTEHGGSLINVTLPSRLNVLGTRVFRNQRNLASFSIASGGLFRTDGNAVYRRPVLATPAYALEQLIVPVSSFEIPNNVSIIRAGAFANMPLTTLTFETGNDVLDLVMEGGNFVNGGAFEGTLLNRVTFPARLTHIGIRAFMGTQLQEAHFPARLIEINDRAFQDVATLHTVTFPVNSQLQRIGTNTGTDSLVFARTGISSISIPHTVRYIRGGSFAGLGNNFNVTFLNSSENSERTATYYLDIGNNAFIGGGWGLGPRGSTMLHYSFRLPNRIRNIGSQAFGNGGTAAALGSLNNVEELFIPKGILSIGSQAFEGNRNIKRIEFEPGSSITTLGTSAFRWNTSLESIMLPANITNTFATNIFLGNYNLREILVVSSATAPSGANGLSSRDGVLFNGNGTTLIHMPLAWRPAVAEGEEVPQTFTYRIPDGVTSIRHNAFDPALTTSASANTGPFSGTRNTTIVRIYVPVSVRDIGIRAFANLSALETVIFDEAATTTDILHFGGANTGNAGVFNYSGIQNIVLPARMRVEGTTTQGAGSLFRNTPNLTDVTFAGPGLNAIPAAFLFGNQGITSLTIPYTVLSINGVSGGGAFENSALEKLTIGTNAQGGSNLRHIQDHSFRGSRIRNLDLSDTDLQSIGTAAGTIAIGVNAFTNSSLESITLPQISRTEGAVITIGQMAFSDTNYLHTINLPNHLTSIGIGAFSMTAGRPSALVSITIPNSVQNIGFNGMVHGGIIKYNPHTGLFQNRTSLRYINMTIPISTATGPVQFRAIAAHQFRGTSFTGDANGHFEIPSDINWIQHFAFQGTHLRSVYIPEGVVHIQEAAFSDMPYLEHIVIPSTVTHYGAGAHNATAFNNRRGLGNAVFANSTALQSVTINGSIQILSERMFQNTPSLIQVTGLDSIHTIEANAFRGAGLESFAIPNTVRAFGSTQLATVTNWSAFVNPFAGMPNLEFLDLVGEHPFLVVEEGVLYNANMTALIAFPAAKVPNEGCEEGYEGIFVIPDSVRYIAAGAFEGAKYIEEIVFPNDFNAMGTEAFMDSSLQRLTNFTGLATIPIRAFAGTKLESVTIPNTVTTIAQAAFAGTSYLTNVNFESGGEAPLAMTAAAASITAPAGHRANVGQFAGSAIQHFTFPSRMTSAAVGARGLFEEAKYLQSVTYDMGETSWTSIGIDAFRGAVNLTTIILPSTITTIGADAFRSTTSLTTLVLPNGLTSLGARAFMESSVTDMVIPSGVLTIMEGLFQNSMLENITILGEITQIQADAFNGAVNLTSVNIPNPSFAMMLQARAFMGTTNLTSLVLMSIGDTANHMQANVFYGWTASQRIYFVGREDPSPNWNIGWLGGTDEGLTIIWNHTLPED
ncbi:MAG: leucine-rich repeat domain-containing protein, partial [Firmicutes bacterium]|nr:leucine-rich repeat domain-containing protein [Bacillota bacterium]